MTETPPRRPVAETRPPAQPSATGAPRRGRRRGSRDADKSPHIRISSITELVRVIPQQMGFTPTESLVIQCLDGKHAARVMRIDLPPASADREPRDRALSEMTAYLSAQLDPVRESCLVVVYSLRPEGLEIATLVGRLVRDHGRQVLATAVVDADEILAISAHGAVVDREPIQVPDTPALTTLKAMNALNGRRVLADRSELAASIAAPHSIGEAIGRCAVIQVAENLDRIDVRADGPRPVPPPLLEAVLQDALDDVDSDGTVSLDVAARLAAYCWSSTDRDALLTRMLGRRSEPWIPVLVSALRRIPAEDSVDLCAVLVVIAYRAGDGALAQVAADRVLASEKRHRLTLLMLDIMFAGLPPDTLDGMCETPP